MKYMVIETFKAGMVDKVYERFNEKGRMLRTDYTILTHGSQLMVRSAFN